VDRDDTPTPPLAIGEPTVLGGRYRLDRELGRGGMGEVFAATDLILHRAVAVKRLHAFAATGGVDAERFYREAQALARVNDPNVVSVFDAGAQDGSPYLVMELVDAPTLRSVLDLEGELPPARAVEIATGVARALAAVHAKGVIHRDVKPSNIFVSPAGRVKLADFGIARLASASTLTAAGEVLGSPTYLAPERLGAGDADPRSDLYSLGCVLFEMLVGRPPFQATDAMAVTYQHVHAQPARVDELDPTLPPALASLVARLLAKDPEDRPQSATELGRELELVDLEPEAVTAVLPGRVSRAPATGDRRWLPWALVGALVIAAPVAVALLAAEDPQASPSSTAPRSGVGTTQTPTSPSTSSSNPSPTDSSTPTSQPSGIGSPEEAAAALLALSDTALDDGRVSEKAAREIERKVDAALRELERKGDTRRALDRLEDLSETITDAFDRGEISTQEVAAELVVAVQALQAAIAVAG
jgi:serine/threonine-protein kinase